MKTKLYGISWEVRKGHKEHHGNGMLCYKLIEATSHKDARQQFDKWWGLKKNNPTQAHAFGFYSEIMKDDDDLLAYEDFTIGGKYHWKVSLYRLHDNKYGQDLTVVVEYDDGHTDCFDVRYDHSLSIEKFREWAVDFMLSRTDPQYSLYMKWKGGGSMILRNPA